MSGEAVNYLGLRALVVGLGDTGLSCVRWLADRGAILRATDSRAGAPHAARLRADYPDMPLTLGRFDPADFAWADLVVVSPGVPMATPELAAARATGKDMVGDVELFARALPALSAPYTLLAITGSNGKSTVTALAGHLCVAAGKRTMVAGNIGLPVLDALAEVAAGGVWPEVWVLELSSFQLETTASLLPDAATVLNLSADHMDRYAGMADYAAAKARIFGSAAASERRTVLPIQVLNRDDPLVMQMARADRTLWTFGLTPGRHDGEWGIAARGDARWLAEGSTPLLPLDSLPIAGLHNAANVLAALALTRAIGVDYAPLLDGLASFRGLPHRVEKVAEIGGVSYYDDSKGTNVGATVAAITGLARPVVLIAGGDGKGQDFTPLRDAMRHARCVVLIGRDAPLIEAAIAAAVPVLHAARLEEAVVLARDMAQPGDAVLLSPACASFDMFRNYVQRAEVFIAAVRQLASPAPAGGDDVS